MSTVQRQAEPQPGKERFYFEAFEDRRPPPPLPYSPLIESLWQFFVVLALAFGARYIWWRWSGSLNPDALWLALPLVLAETLAYVGLILFAINLWSTRDPALQPPPQGINDCLAEPLDEDRPVAVDVFIATYNEDEELVRLSILDAKALRRPNGVNLCIHVLDDGRRALMRQVAEEEGVNYITRSNNAGFKAGNLRNAMEQTSGDFIVICDADTRLFPTYLEHTLGYFRDPHMAWVQTPQWFYDIPQGRPLPDWLARYMGTPGRWIGRAVERVVGEVPIGRDPFANDPKMFYDVILRRRNPANAAFCCGAASIHRREAVMQAALRAYGTAVEQQVGKLSKDIRDAGIKRDFEDAVRGQLAIETEFTPYKFHVSEDIYTSIVLHNDPDQRWKSVLHPQVESKMLSPQDLLAWATQRFKYAGGTLDIALRDNPLFKGRMSLRQRLMYLSTFWSYFGGLWNLVFLLAPIVTLFTGISPLRAYSMEFYLHFLPFVILNEVAFMFGTWGVAAWEGKASYLSFFSINLRALWTVLKGEKIKFPVTPKNRQEGNFLHMVWPQIAIVALTVLGLAVAALRVFAFGADEELPVLIVISVWSLYNIAAMLPMIRAALWKPEDEPTQPDDAASGRQPGAPVHGF
ncbi:glycosyltransferase [Azohydromonas australica]|uniref:glycosyltransferase n=1 Tax=Azohydromonas australica TaxID=364039 RepID=UPI00040AE44E|nr:glycosyltransferase [Azohydromonas australica]